MTEEGGGEREKGMIEEDDGKPFSLFGVFIMVGMVLLFIGFSVWYEQGKVTYSYLATLHPPENATHYQIYTDELRIMRFEVRSEVTTIHRIESRPLTWMWAQKLHPSEYWHFNFHVKYYAETAPGILESVGTELVSKTLYFYRGS